MSAVSKEQEWPADTVYADPPSKPYPVGKGQIATAFSKAQLEMHNPKFDSVNPFFKSKFASLAAVRNAVIPLLAKYQICLAQDLITTENAVSCFTILTHGSGQDMKFGPLTLPVGKKDAQGYAAAGTYAKRIQMQAVCGVVGDEDDDGQTAVDKAQGQAYAEPHKPQGDAAKAFPEDEARNLATAMRGLLEDDVEERVKALRVLDYHDLLNHKGSDAYIAASEQMSSKERAAWKSYVKMAKDAEKADAASAPQGKRW